MERTARRVRMARRVKMERPGRMARLGRMERPERTVRRGRMARRVKMARPRRRGRLRKMAGRVRMEGWDPLVSRARMDGTGKTDAMVATAETAATVGMAKMRRAVP
jgi:hypothetical protein